MPFSRRTLWRALVVVVVIGMLPFITVADYADMAQPSEQRVAAEQIPDGATVNPADNSDPLFAFEFWCDCRIVTTGGDYAVSRNDTTVTVRAVG